MELTVEAISILTNRVVDMTLEVRKETAAIRRETEEMKAQGERDRVWQQEMIERMDERIEEQRRYNQHLRPLHL